MYFKPIGMIEGNVMYGAYYKHYTFCISDEMGMFGASYKDQDDPKAKTIYIIDYEYRVLSFREAKDACERVAQTL